MQNKLSHYRETVQSMIVYFKFWVTVFKELFVWKFCKIPSHKFDDFFSEMIIE